LHEIIEGRVRGKPI